MKYLQLKMQKIQKNLLKNEIHYMLYKSLLNNYKINYTQKDYILNKMMCSSIRKYLRMRLKRRCIVSNRGKGVYSFFSLSRMPIKKYMSYKYLNGIQKSSW